MNTYFQMLKAFLSKGPTYVVLLVLILLSIKIAHASIVSFVAGLLGSEKVSAETENVSSGLNSQNLNILAAAVNADPNPNKPAEIMPVLNGETLAPDLAQNGTIEDESSTQISTYVVREGDTISGVAKMFKVSVNTVLWANNLTGKSVLKTGQNLIILPVTGISHKVEKNDTVQGIAKKYKADVSEIYSYNDLSSSSKLSIGQVLIIPNAEVPAQSSGAKSGKSGSAGSASGLPSYAGYFACPTVGKMSQDLHGKNGIDLAAPVGTPIRASAAGTVIISKSDGGWNGGYGNFVVVSHGNGTQTLYSHMSRSTVSVGETVSKGQSIGYIGMTGLTTGPHLHFEVRGAVNPFRKDLCR